MSKTFSASFRQLWRVATGGLINVDIPQLLRNGISFGPLSFSHISTVQLLSTHILLSSRFDAPALASVILDRNSRVTVTPLDRYFFSPSDFPVQKMIDDRKREKREKAKQIREMRQRRKMELRIHQTLPIEPTESENTKTCCTFICASFFYYECHW